MLRWLRPPEAAALTAAERRRIRATINRQQLGQLRVALVIGAAIAAMLPFVLDHVYAGAPRWVILAPLAVTGILLAFAAFSGTALAQRHIELYEVTSGTLVVVGLAVLATHTGGFESPVLPATFLIWIV